MKKADRQRLIRQIITENEIETQEELIARLEAAGVKATQATVSRDVREMSIVKTHGAANKVKYAIFSQQQTASQEDKLKESVKDSVIRIEKVQFMVIVHTDMGRADVVTNFLDEVNYSEVAGTVAGVDTIIIIARSEEDAVAIVERFEAMMRNE
ncbi:arginine repressor [Enterococcus sp. BWB1-3]|uniref:arginine repressor n=1 Tax=unclassified Enterococcus TaxID=2608891 RepID=UPI00192249EE|nr:MULTISPECIES: arginine repressor [unclassified Enterococcus]MBL1228699.1 arginine repressor [Enterococcus sp. BWB1-3]MCB5952771.1 arginine repressor [Enterococcus sp. BWT-B8]MCB5953689.1 arginine repressor [Enterococcus sp. CWB-B31]